MELTLLLAAAAIAGGAVLLHRYRTGLTPLRRIHPARPGQIKVACVGNSNTYGYGIPGWPRGSYPELLGTLLGSRFHVANFGLSSYCVQNGTNKPYRKTGLFAQSLTYQPDILILMMSGNDAKLENWRGTEAFRQAYVALLEEYLDCSRDLTVFLCTLPCPHPNEEGAISFGIQPEAIAEISATVRALAAERGFHLLDLYALTQAQAGWFQADGIHLNTAGTQALAALAAAAIGEHF